VAEGEGTQFSWTEGSILLFMSWMNKGVTSTEELAWYGGGATHLGEARGGY
jgi:hypothetical protein